MARCDITSRQDIILYVEYAFYNYNFHVKFNERTML